jgi:lysophospholipase L1-like esterase
MGFRGPEVATPKPPGVFRVVLLGGSTSLGSGVGDDETIDAHLRRTLERASPDRRIEVVNFGVDGQDALCDLERLRTDGLRLDPDAVIVHDGINDVPAVRFPSLAPAARERGFRPRLRRDAEARLREVGVWRAVKRHSFLARVPGVVKDLLGRSAPVEGPAEPAPGGLEAFAATILAMADVVPASTVLLLSSPPSALSQDGHASPVTMGVVDAATTQRYRVALDERMRAVAAELAARGRRASYVPHDVPGEEFVDDCHLTSQGNRRVAEDFATVLAPLIGP